MLVQREAPSQFPERSGWRARIVSLAAALPQNCVTNAALATQQPGWNFELLAAKAGVEQRHVARDDETALDLAEAACRILLNEVPERAAALDVLISCTQSPDHILPSNSCRLHGRLQLPQRVATFDLSHACSGYVYSLQLAQAFIRSQMARKILIVTAETYSKFIHPSDRSARSLFGDGAAATWLEATDDAHGVLDVQCGTDGSGFEHFYIPAGGARCPSSTVTRQETTDASGNVRSDEQIHMAGREILSFVSTVVPRQIRELLDQNRVTPDDVDLFVFHQASAMALDVITRELRLSPEKVFRNLAKVGNTVSASIPLALLDAQRAGLLTEGKLVVLCGFGAGLSWGSALLRW